jgi:hypothetical protein
VDDESVQLLIKKKKIILYSGEKDIKTIFRDGIYSLRISGNYQEGSN